MILVFDVGNTETTIGLFDGEALRGHWRVTTDVARTPDEIALLIRALAGGESTSIDAPSTAPRSGPWYRRSRRRSPRRASRPSGRRR